MDSSDILESFLAGKYQRMECPQCENTFLTKVYIMGADTPPLGCPRSKADSTTDKKTDREFVILEKYALGLEYFCDAIQTYGLTQIPLIRRIGILNDDDEPLDPARIQLFSHEEPDYRLIYVMERLEHLNAEDTAFFTDHVHDIDWMEEHDRQRVWQWVAERYGQPLAEDIRKLCRYYRVHDEYVSWDLHGDNLMRRTRNGEIVVMDPFTLKFG